MLVVFMLQHTVVLESWPISNQFILLQIITPNGLKKYQYTNYKHSIETIHFKKDNEVYTLKELADKNIKADTSIKHEGDDEWTEAGNLEELKELITLNNSYNDIKASNKPHVRIPSIWELMMLSIVLGLLQLLIPIHGDLYGGYTIDVAMITPLKMNVYKLVAFIIFVVYVYNIFTYRYYRLVKLKEENNSGGNTYYLIQTCISFRKSVDKLNEQSIKWFKSEEPFKLTRKEEFKKCFDKITRTIRTPLATGLQTPAQTNF